MISSYYKDIYNILCKRHPNKKIYIISDHHFYHSNIIRYQRPEFSDVKEMNEYIISMHNRVVKEDDIVIFLGDFSFKKSFIKDLLAQMNGHKYLLLGNHDEENLTHCYGNLGFEGIFTNPIKINDKFLSHYPLRENECDGINFKALVKEFNSSNAINYHGHIHTRNIGENPFVNVCCEAQNYKPLLIGYTEKLVRTNDSPLVINSQHFESILKYLKKEKQLDPNLVISDYIYSMLLEAITPYENSSFIYGSFPLYKKYGYISNFSDLDVCLVYNENISCGKNKSLLKEVFDIAFENAKKVDNLNFSLDKRMSNMCIFELLYTNKNGNRYRGYYDTNLVPLDTYRNSDFVTTYGCSTLESTLKYEMDLINDFKLPRYKSRFLTTNGDIANITLQLLFQQGFTEKKALSLKKLIYIYRTYGEHDISNVSDLEDIMVRFFIRNIVFFHTTRRSKDIEYINEGYRNLDDFMNAIPSTLKLQMEEILKNPYSLFNIIYKEISEISFDEIPKKGKELIKTIKYEN